MKTTNKTTVVEVNFTNLISELSVNRILDTREMMSVRGGEGEGSGLEPIIIPPIKP
jgi:hypothetical protein